MILPGKKNKSLEKHITFYTFLRIRASSLRRLVKNSCTVVKTAFYMYKRTIQESFDVWEESLLFLSLLNFNQNMLDFCEKVRHGGQNCIPPLQMILPRKKNKSLEKHITFYTFLRIRASSLRRLVKTSCTVVKTAFYLYEVTIQETFDVWEERLLFLSLLNFNQNLLDFCEKVRHGGQNCIPRLQMILPRKKNKSLE